MSRQFRAKHLDLIKLDLVSANYVWDKTKLRKGKPTLNKKFDYYGRKS